MLITSSVVADPRAAVVCYPTQEREQRRSLKVHEKLNYTGRMNAKRGLLRRALRVGEDEGGEPATGAGEEALEPRDSPVGKLAMLKGTASPGTSHTFSCVYPKNIHRGPLIPKPKP